MVTKKEVWEKPNQEIIRELNAWMSDYLNDFYTIVENGGIAAQALPGFDPKDLVTDIDMTKSDLYADIYSCLPIVYTGLVSEPDFAEGLVAWANLIEEQTPSSLKIEKSMPTVWHIYQSTTARSALEGGYNLTLDGLARLAGVDIRTVRNAVAKKELTTFKDKISGVCIRSDDAKAWLKDRKGFIPTVWENLEPVSESDHRKMEFLKYLEEKCAEAGFSQLSEVSTTIGWEAETLSRESFLLKGVCPFPLEHSPLLSQELNLDERELTLRVMRAFYQDTLNLLNNQKELDH